MRSKCENMTELEIQSRLCERYPLEHFHIVLKCWDLIDPIGFYYNHCGEHTKIVQACIDSPRFPSLMKECRAQADSLWASGENMIRVMCICERGWHTSVAVACILKAFYSEKGYTSLGPCHLSRIAWYKNLCNVCVDCQHNDTREKMFRTLACPSGDLEDRCHKTS